MSDAGAEAECQLLVGMTRLERKSLSVMKEDYE